MSLCSPVQQLNMIVPTKTASVHGLRDVLIIRHELCRLASKSHVPASSTEVIPN